MIGIVIIAHNKLSVEFCEAVRHIMGPQAQLESVSIYGHDESEDKRQELIQKTKLVDQGEGVIILADMFGGTPSNLAPSLMEKNKVEVIVGFNLPLLIKLIDIRGKYPLKEVLPLVEQAGKKYVQLASTLLKQA